MRSSVLVAASLLAGLSLSVLADQPDTRAHQHGVARLELFKLGTDLQITFYAAASDIVGFEHQPKTQAERDAVKKATMRLAQSDQLFQIEGAHCELKQHQSSLAELQKHSASEHKHQHDHKDDHDHKNSGHSDVEVSYLFSCTSDENSVTVRIKLFDAFPELQRIDSSWLTDKAQSAATLTAKDNKLSLH